MLANHNISSKNEAAFSLIELLMIFVLIFIFLAAALPFMSYLRSENTVQSTAFSLTSALDLTRQTAVAQQTKVRLCASSNGQHCGGSWRQGYLVITDDNALIHVWQSLGDGGNIIWNNSSGDDESIEFLPTGFTNGQRGTFYLCSNNHNVSISKTVVIIATGRWSIRSMSLQDWQRYC
jgi:type IV fimbrial biogenesis protein FimT